MRYYILADADQSPSNIHKLSTFDLYEDENRCREEANENQRIYGIEFNDQILVSRAIASGISEGMYLNFSRNRDYGGQYDLKHNVTITDSSKLSFKCITKSDKYRRDYELDSNEPKSARKKPDSNASDSIQIIKNLDGFYTQSLFASRNNSKKEINLPQAWLEIKNTFSNIFGHVTVNAKKLLADVYKLKGCSEAIHPNYIWGDENLQTRRKKYKHAHNLLHAVEQAENWYTINNDAHDDDALKITAILKANLIFLMDTLDVRNVPPSKNNHFIEYEQIILDFIEEKILTNKADIDNLMKKEKDPNQISKEQMQFELTLMKTL